MRGFHNRAGVSSIHIYHTVHVVPEHNMLQHLPIIPFSNSQKHFPIFFQFLPQVSTCCAYIMQKKRMEQFNIVVQQKAIALVAITYNMLVQYGITYYTVLPHCIPAILH